MRSFRKGFDVIAEPPGEIFLADGSRDEIENNLKVNPASGECNIAEAFPCICWGLRLASPGAHNMIIGSGAPVTCQKVMTPHLEPVLDRIAHMKRAIEAGKTNADAPFDIGSASFPAAG